MSRVLVLLVALCPSALAADTVTFGDMAFPVGLVVDSTEDLAMDVNLSLAMGDRTMEMPTRKVESSARKVKVLDAGDEVTRFEVKWSKNHVEEEGGMAPPKVSDDHVGQKFVVDLSGAEPVFTLDGGAAPGSADQQLHAVSKMFVDDLRVAGDGIRGRTLTVGDVIEGTDSFANTMMSDPPPGAEIDMTGGLTFKGARKDRGVHVGVFGVDVSMKMTGAADAMRMDMTMTLKGDLFIAVDSGWLHGVDASGELRMDAAGDQQGQAVSMKGGGDVKMKLTHSYSR